MKESGENYLETILLLKKRQGYVRSIDIATELGYSKPSISRAIGILKEDGFLEVERDGNILLTEQGEQKAGEIYWRHRVLTEYLSRTLDIDRETAVVDACRFEHIISRPVMDAVESYVLGELERTGESLPE